MNLPSIQHLVSAVPSSLGSCGPVLKEIEAELQSPQCSPSTIGEAIEKDPDLTSRLLRLGNSPFYGYTSRLTSVAEAISLIGIRRVQDLLMASSIIERFSGVDEKHVNMESFWRHSLACGIAARVVAMELRLPKPDKFFVAGLLHDVGRLVLLGQSPEAAQQVFVLYKKEPMLLREAEMKVLGYDHQQIGGALLRHWRYPATLIGAVANHHHPALAETGKEEAAIVHFCDHLVNAMQIGCSGEQHAPPLNMKAWENLRLPIEALPMIVDAVDDQIDTVLAAFLKH
jgi:putative nucleotidyltransferase with HDIG domain